MCFRQSARAAPRILLTYVTFRAILARKRGGGVLVKESYAPMHLVYASRLCRVRILADEKKKLFAVVLPENVLLLWAHQFKMIKKPRHMRPPKLGAYLRHYMKVAVALVVFALTAALVQSRPAYAGASPYAGARVELSACRTIAHSLLADWANTKAVMTQPFSREINPVIRTIGPDAYFGILLIISNSCQETKAWRLGALIFWAVQTWSVNMSPPIYTPYLWFTIRW